MNLFNEVLGFDLRASARHLPHYLLEVAFGHRHGRCLVGRAPHQGFDTITPMKRTAIYTVLAAAVTAVVAFFWRTKTRKDESPDEV